MRWIIITSFIVALLLAVYPLQVDWRWWRPEFIALLVIYWSMYTPHNFGIAAAWGVGLVQDLVEICPLGQNSLGLIVVAYICHLSYQRIRNYALWQQAMWVFVLVGIYQLFGNWVGGLVDEGVESPIFLLSAIVSGFMWPLIVVLLQRIRIYLHLL